MMRRIARKALREKQRLLEHPAVQAFLVSFVLAEDVYVSLRKKHLQAIGREVPARVPLHVIAIENTLAYYNLSFDDVRTVFGTHDASTYRMMRNRIMHGASVSVMQRVIETWDEVSTVYEAFFDAVFSRFETRV